MKGKPRKNCIIQKSGVAQSCKFKLIEIMFEKYIIVEI